MKSGGGASTGELSFRFDDVAAQPAGDALADWYAQHLPRDAGPVLDAASGGGHLLLALLERGLHMHGVEESACALAACEERLRAADRAAPLFRQPLAGLNLPFRYAAIVVPGAALQRLPANEPAVAVLERLRAHLVAPGVLVVEFAVPAIAEHRPGAPVVEIERVRLADGSAITRRTEIGVDADGHRIDRRERYEQRRGTDVVAREDRRLAITWYTEDEALALVQDAGFHEARIESLPRTDGATGGRRFAVIAAT